MRIHRSSTSFPSDFRHFDPTQTGFRRGNAGVNIFCVMMPGVTIGALVTGSLVERPPSPLMRGHRLQFNLPWTTRPPTSHHKN